MGRRLRVAAKAVSPEYAMTQLRSAALSECCQCPRRLSSGPRHRGPDARRVQRPAEVL